MILVLILVLRLVSLLALILVLVIVSKLVLITIGVVTGSYDCGGIISRFVDVVMRGKRWEK